ncbi:MAG: iron chelate uptake ABC transporter family permease subunit [Propionibacteriaceae bacterium]|nr:iron chelate uptake ABC transporter family permease subunit [Propionibacteriaceae bacterium]
MRTGGFLLAGVCLVTACALSLGVGAHPTPPGVLLEVLTTQGDSDAHAIVRERVPRTLLGLFVGCSLGGCGALIQAYTRNPLADPGLLGVNAGATFAITMGAGFLGLRAPHQYVWLALGGALATTVLVYVIGRSGRDGATPVRLVLTGVAIEAVLVGLSSFIILKNLAIFQALRFWGVGSLGGRDPAVLTAVLPVVAVGLGLAVPAATMLNATALGDDLGRGLGVRLPVSRGLAVAGVTLLGGGAVAMAGSIGFVGLMVPHVVRWFTGPDQRLVLFGSILAAPTLLLGADVLGRVVLPNGELPVGIATAVVGAPVLIVLARRQKVGAL